jgi:hypothetical protein
MLCLHFGFPQLLRGRRTIETRGAAGLRRAVLFHLQRPACRCHVEWDVLQQPLPRIPLRFMACSTSFALLVEVQAVRPWLLCYAMRCRLQKFCLAEPNCCAIAYVRRRVSGACVAREQGVLRSCNWGKFGRTRRSMSDALPICDLRGGGVKRTHPPAWGFINLCSSALVTIVA